MSANTDPDSQTDNLANEDCRPVPCSPFDALMGQIEAMRDRARQYAEESEAEQNYEEGHRHRSVEGTLNELHRLGKFFEENEKSPSTGAIE